MRRVLCALSLCTALFALQAVAVAAEPITSATETKNEAVQPDVKPKTAHTSKTTKKSKKPATKPVKHTAKPKTKKPTNESEPSATMTVAPAAKN